MTQHADLIERLRYEPTASQYLSLSDLIASLHEDRKNAADALEAQAREIAELKAQLAATAKNAFLAMPPDIPTRMKRQICVDADWSGSLASRAYIEIRKAFTGEPYRANEDLDAALAECERLRKDAERYRFLRDTCWLDTPLEHVICLQMNAKWDRAIDEAIDAAKEPQP